jgi:hypothetical protein
MSGSATWERVGQNSGLLLHWVPDNSGQAPLMISHWLGPAEFTIVEHFGQRVCILRICADGGHDQAGIRFPSCRRRTAFPAQTHQRCFPEPWRALLHPFAEAIAKYGRVGSKMRGQEGDEISEGKAVSFETGPDPKTGKIKAFTVDLA